MTEPVVTVERVGNVALITLNRPDSMNAVNSALTVALGGAVEELNNDNDLRVGVITGAGRAFSAGADLKAIAKGEAIFDPDHPEWGFAGLVRHFIDKPLIAAVNGFALGGGTEIALACDLIVVSEEAKFGLPEVKRGLIALAGGLIRLPSQIPLKLALEVALTGEPIDAATAARWGMVNRVVPPDQVVQVAMELAQTIAANAPLSVRASKRIMYRSAEFGSEWHDDIWSMNMSEGGPVFASKDAREGPRAFAEKRTPEWKGE
ncbi:crotonase/enoyl-CoA hydratase family protein [Antrihabitans cavernicola]|uniref:Probable enoyl-CoA hydratase EchA17 n=1 Tax=Antrihabitans cavernicola TaxID=2495913 RepID=A0A5A7SBW4_9NOCA|nr:crotonase/enoyl-CoA hydratase family protein [Spelaeibacter cavernicola]KAA0023608.1 crotonase/enoyl-CoA hydratase family protein [Spelaeibacter cavernicola]